MIRASAFYSNKEGAKFDFDYYRDRHFPMVLELLRPFGAIRFEIERGVGMSDGRPPKFIAIGSLYIDSLDGLSRGMAVHGEQISADVKNYTDLSPTLQFSEIV
jgi:uncharacterized protein (TIGR02118 family)